MTESIVAITFVAVLVTKFISFSVLTTFHSTLLHPLLHVCGIVISFG